MATGLDPRRLYRELVDNDRQLRELVRAQPTNVHEANMYRARLMEKARLIADVSATFAAAKELEQVLWKPCFYKRIEDFRLRIRKYATASAQDPSVREHFARISMEFQQFLADATAFYEHLREAFTKWVQQHRVTRIAPAPTARSASMASSGATEAEVNMGKCRQSLFRCLVFLGDLARYRELHSQKAKKNFTAAENYYHRALQLMPENGNPHNQLAVLATYVEAETVAVYRYCRSLFSAQPFATAEENLVLLFERTRQRPLAPPSLVPLTSASPNKEKSAFLKSFLHRLTRSHGIVFSIATRHSAVSNGSASASYAMPSRSQTALTYPKEMESILLKDLRVLFTAGAIGDALLLKVMVINIFCLMRALETPVMLDALRLTTLITTTTMSFLVDELTRLTEKDHPNTMRLMGPVSTFCDFLRYNPHVIDAIEAQLQSSAADAKPFAAAFVDALVTLLNHSRVKAAVGQVEGDDATLRDRQLSLKENIELRGFLPLSPLLEMSSNKWKDELGTSQQGNTPGMADAEAFKVRSWNLHKFGKFLCEDYEGNPLLYQCNGVYSTAPVVDTSKVPSSAPPGTKKSSSPVNAMPTIGLGMLKENSSPVKPVASRVVDQDDELEDEVIVFQPSPALTPMNGPMHDMKNGGSAALGGESNAMLLNGGNDGMLLSGSTTPSSAGPVSSIGKSGSGSSRLGSAVGAFGASLGYPNFHSFNDFGNMPNKSMFTGWGTTSSNSSSETSMGFPTLSAGNSLPSSSSPFAFSNASSDGFGTYGGGLNRAGMSSMDDLNAIEEQSALYQREESSLNAILGAAASKATPPPPRPSSTRAPPGFSSTSAPPGFEQDKQASSTGSSSQGFFTRNPFINQ